MIIHLTVRVLLHHSHSLEVLNSIGVRVCVRVQQMSAEPKGDNKEDQGPVVAPSSAENAKQAMLHSQWRLTLAVAAKTSVVFSVTISTVIAVVTALLELSSTMAWASTYSTAIMVVGTVVLMATIAVFDAIENEWTVPLFAPLERGTMHHFVRTLLLSALTVAIATATLAAVIRLWWCSSMGTCKDIHELLSSWNVATRIIAAAASLGVFSAVLIQYMVIHQQVKGDKPVLGLTPICRVHTMWRRVMRSVTMDVCLLLLVGLFAYHQWCIWTLSYDGTVAVMYPLANGLMKAAIGGACILGTLHMTETA